MDIIKSSADISFLFQKGRRLGTPYLTLIVMKKDEQHDLDGRVAFIAGKKLGNAVWRNKAKRRMRGLCRDLNGPFSPYDTIFLAKAKINDAPYDAVLKASRKALQKANIL